MQQNTLLLAWAGPTQLPTCFSLDGASRPETPPSRLQSGGTAGGDHLPAELNPSTGLQLFPSESLELLFKPYI